MSRYGGEAPRFELDSEFDPHCDLQNILIDTPIQETGNITSIVDICYCHDISNFYPEMEQHVN